MYQHTRQILTDDGQVTARAFWIEQKLEVLSRDGLMIALSVVE